MNNLGRGEGPTTANPRQSRPGGRTSPSKWDFVKSFYYDPTKWNFVKSAGFFIIAVYVIRDLASNDMIPME